MFRSSSLLVYDFPLSNPFKQTVFERSGNNQHLNCRARRHLFPPGYHKLRSSPVHLLGGSFEPFNPLVACGFEHFQVLCTLRRTNQKISLWPNTVSHSEVRFIKWPSHFFRINKIVQTIQTRSMSPATVSCLFATTKFMLSAKIKRISANYLAKPFMWRMGSSGPRTNIVASPSCPKLIWPKISCSDIRIYHSGNPGLNAVPRFRFRKTQ